MSAAISVPSSGRPLTEEMLTVKGGSLETLKTVNVWASQITSLAVLRKCSSLEVCSLSQNLISDLSPLAACARLREVYLRRNLVRDLAALAPLASLPELRIVWLEENEVAADARYRPFLIRLCRRLEKIDGVP